MKEKREYPSKVMLVGEYGVVTGGSALTIPFPRFGARVRSAQDIPAGREEEALQSLKYLKELFEYIRKIPENQFHAKPDLEYFYRNLETWWLDLNIPVGYGLGSSGAVSAAVYDMFFLEQDSLGLQKQKEDLAAIESYFHGRSSGLDALTCHGGTALRLFSTGTIERVQFDVADLPGAYRFFLLDSGERFDTGPLVKYFLSRMKDPDYRRAIEKEYLPLNELLITTLLGERETDAAMLVKLISDFQLRYFRRMIPEKVIDLWLDGQTGDEYYLKLNGSGGGFMLGITHHSLMEGLEERWGPDLHWLGRSK